MAAPSLSSYVPFMFFPIQILEEAAEACRKPDFVMTDQIVDAIEAMRVELHGRCPAWAFRQLRHSFEIDEPQGRSANVNASMNAIRRACRGW